MRVYRRNKWDVTHSLTPKPEVRPNPAEYTYNIPEIPDRKVHPLTNRHYSNNNAHRSRKHRLIEERNTEI